jgi:hypothetical protein
MNFREDTVSEDANLSGPMARRQLEWKGANAT